MPGAFITINTWQQTRSSLQSRIRYFSTSDANSLEASWRRIQVVQSDLSSERLRELCVNFKPAQGDINTYYDKFEYEDGSPLGEVFESLVRVMGRTEEEHSACLAVSTAQKGAIQASRDVR